MHKLLKQAFTLIELLVVIAIIGILSGLIMVSMSGVSNKARIAKAQVFNNSLKNSLMLNLVSEWKFNEGAGSIAYDSWRKEHNGTIYGTTWKTGSDCIFDNCLYFNGSTDWVDFGNLGIYDSATISLWFKKNDSSSTQYLLDGRAGGSWWLLTYYGGYDITFYNVVTYNGISSNTWYNLVITASSSNGTKMYLDGNLVSTGVSLIPNLSTIRMGTRYTNSGYFAGYIDEFRMYDAVISSSLIKQNYYIGLNNLLFKGGITNQEYQNRINELTAKIKIN